MGVLRPVPMRKVRLVGLKRDREAILSTLHDLRVAQIEPISPPALAVIGAERAPEEQRVIGEELLRFRGLKSALPPVPVGRREQFRTRSDVLAAARSVTIDEEVCALRREEDRRTTERASAMTDRELLDRLAFYPGRLEYLTSASVYSFAGEASAEAFETLRRAPELAGTAELLVGPSGETVTFLLIVRREAATALPRFLEGRGVRWTAIPPGWSGTVAEERARRQAIVDAATQRLAEIRRRLAEIAERDYAKVAAIEEALTIENRKLEVYGKLGGGQATFALEAWVPRRDVDRLRAALERVTDQTVVLEILSDAEAAPTLMENPRGVRWFEFFIRFYSLPQANEWDPTLVFAIVFPIFFGLMLGDWGYGLVILLISLWMIRGFPGDHRLPKFGRNFVKMIMGPNAMRQLALALVPGCLVAIGLGLYWDEFFGYPLFARWFGYHATVTPIGNVGLLLLIAGYIGLGMVTLGFLFGAIQEWYTGHRRGAFAKVGGILFAWGLAEFGLAVLRHQTSFTGNPFLGAYVGLMGAGLALLIGLEGVQTGAMGLIEVVSHILSYTRLIGILLASVILALVFNDIAGGQFGAAAPAYLVLGLVILVVGQTFNTILGVFEPGIQGARLIFVEYFSKFYHGNGRGFHPFGSERKYTEPAPAFADVRDATGRRALP